MRRLVIAVTVLVAASFGTTTLLTQNFDGAWSTGSPPAGWRIFHTGPGIGPDDWHRDTAHATPWDSHPSPFAAIQSDLGADATPDSLISPTINCSAYHVVTLACSTLFYYWSPNSYSAKLVYSTDGGATWPFTLHDYYTNHPNPPDSAIAETLSLDQAAGKANVKIAWVFNGDLNFIQGWFVDDIVVSGESTVRWDVACQSIVYPTSRVPPGNFLPTASFINNGSNTQTNVPVNCSLYTSAMVGLRSWTSTIASLAPGVATNVTFSPGYNLPLGQYFIKFWSRADSDQVRSNDTLSRFFDGSLLRTVSYDNGNNLFFTNFTLGHYGYGMEFDADTSPVYIESLEVYLHTPGTAASCGYQLAIFLDDGSGKPGKLFYKTPVQYAPPSTTAWNSIYLGSAGNQLVMPTGKFYVFYLQVGEDGDCPQLGCDNDGPNPLTTHWEDHNGIFTPTLIFADFMIRAVVNMGTVTPAPVDLRTLYVDQPLYDWVGRPYNLPMTPKARIENFGSTTVSPVAVRCSIVGTVGGPYYAQAETLASLAAGQDTLVTFPTWLPTQTERCSVIVRTLVSGGPDPVPQNDDKRFSVDVLKGAFTGVSPLHYRWIDSDTLGGPTYAWIDTNGMSAKYVIGDNNPLTIPFEPGMNFPFYDSLYNYVYVSSNGWVGLGLSADPGSDMDSFPAKIPTPSAPNRCIYAYWDNLAVGSPWGHGSIRYRWFGTTPNRYMVVVFQDVNRIPTDTSKGLTFELIFRENGVVTCQYKAVTTGNVTYDNGRHACVGLENQGGTDGLCYLYGVPPMSTAVNGIANRLSAGRAISFFPERPDAAALAIIRPASSDFPGVITPKAKIQNYGTVPGSIRAFMTIGSYASDTLSPVLIAGDSAIVTFRPCTLALGTYPVCCSVHIAGDVNGANDAIYEMMTASPWASRAGIPPSYHRRRVQSGALCYAPTTNKFYALKGSNTTDFWEYDVTGDSWDTLAPMPTAPSGKKPRDGAHLTFDPNFPVGSPGLGRIWAFKGNGVADFYYFDIAADSWVAKRPALVTAFAAGHEYRPPKKGASIVYVGGSGSKGSVYAIPGNRTNYFWRYDIAKDSWFYPHDSVYVQSQGTPYWQPVPLDIPPGPFGKRCNYGSDLAYLNNMIFALKGSGTVEAYGFSYTANAWTETLDQNSFYGTGLRPVKAGGSLVANGNNLYALKGGNTQQFWHYNFTRKVWLRNSDIPFAVSRHVKVNGGTAMASDDSVIFCLKGSNTYEFWEYQPSADTVPTLADYQPKREGVEAENTFDLSRPWLTAYPNPTHVGVNISYNITSAAPTRIRVYDAAGKVVTQLCDAGRTRGPYVTHWSGLAANGRRVPAGIYFVKLESGATRLTQKLVIQQ